MTTALSDGTADNTNAEAAVAAAPPAGSPDAAAADGGKAAGQETTAPAAAAETSTTSEAAKNTEEPKAESKDEPKSSDEKSKADGTPEKYEDFKLPEGFKAPEGFQGEVSALAKDLGLNQEKAQKLANTLAEQNKSFVESINQTLDDSQKSWESQLAADKEIGGEKLDANLAVAKAGLKAFDPEGHFLSVLEQTKLGSHPAVVKAFYRMGLRVQETAVSTSSKGSPANSASPVEKRLYPNMN
jgi:hypothetical protein